MKVGIIGFGFVGKAIKNGLKDSVKVFIVDPNIGSSIKDLDSFDPDIVFLCLPTPYGSKTNVQDTSIFIDVLKEIKNLSFKNALFVLKSTISPENLHIFDDIERFVYNPEFLTELNANDDFINADFSVIGGRDNQCELLKQFYKKYTKCRTNNYLFTDVISASLIKYAINSFLATKVTFFNELFDLFNSSGTNEDWETFIEIIKNDSRIGNTHMQVPGHDGRRGFGGACFPKDISAFLTYSKKINSNFSLLETVIKSNNKIRQSYNDLTEREESQNVNFED